MCDGFEEDPKGIQIFRCDQDECRSECRCHSLLQHFRPLDTSAPLGLRSIYIDALLGVFITLVVKRIRKNRREYPSAGP